jgi:heat shock protein HslJ
MSCDNTTKDKMMFINSYKVDCTGVGKMQCLQVKYTDSDNWIYFYDTIEGFDFKPGYLYQIEVSIEAIDTFTLPSDKSNLKFTLKKVISKQKDITFRLNDIWVVTHINNEELDKASFQLPQLEISLKNKQLLGNDGCNNIKGTINRITDSEIELGPMMGTKKMCPQMDIPNKFNRVISEIRSYKLGGLELIFFDKKNKEIMRSMKFD